MAFVDRQTVVFSVLWILVSLILAYDTYFLIRIPPEILSYSEQNPLGQFLLAIDPNPPAIFVTVKFAGTCLGLGFLAAVFVLSPRIGILSISFVSVLAVILFLYLTFG